MEYYKTLFFNKSKHSYELNEIDFYMDDSSKIMVYDNVPTVGFKITTNGILDPISGYIFHPKNFYSFKSEILKRNCVVNGICTLPLIFDYDKNSAYNVLFYDDVKDSLVEVSVDEKISLSTSSLGMLLRSIDDELYYIYLGLVGVFYVDIHGKTSIKKKHAVFKIATLYDNTGDDINIYSNKITYIDYKKDTDKKYFKVKTFDMDKVYIKPYYVEKKIVLGDYISNGVFDIELFSDKHPSFCITPKVRKLLNKDKLNKTHNCMVMSAEKIGLADISLHINANFSSSNATNQTLQNNTFTYEVISDLDLDFNSNNYAIDFNGTLFLIDFDGLNSSGFYQPSFTINRFKYAIPYSVIPRFKLFALSTYGISWTKPKYTKPTIDLDLTKEYDIYRVYYSLNDKFSYNIVAFDNPVFNEYRTEIVDKSVFDEITTTKTIKLPLLGMPYDFTI